MANAGDLDQKLEQAKKHRQYIKENKIWYIFKNVLEGVEALHSSYIVHRDIKCANIFLTKDGGVLLGDMNVSKVSYDGLMQTPTGTPFQCPPEVWRDGGYTSKCDIWSLGCVIYELAALQPPFNAKSLK